MEDRTIKYSKKVQKIQRPKYLLEFFSSFLIIFLLTLPPSLATTPTSKESMKFITDIFFYLANINIIRIFYLISITLFVFYLYINKDISTTSMGIANKKRVNEITNINVVIVFGLQLLGGILASLILYVLSTVCGTFESTTSLASFDTSIKGFIFKYGEGYHKFANDNYLFITFQVFLNMVFIWVFFFFTINYVSESKKTHSKLFARWIILFFMFLIAYRFCAHSFDTSRILAPAIVSYVFDGANNLRLAIAFAISQIINYTILALFTTNYKVKGI